MATHVKRSVEVAVSVRAAYGQWTVGPRSPRVPGDPASGVLTGYPGARIGHTETGGQGADDTAAGGGVVAMAVAGLPGSGRTQNSTTIFLATGDWLLITWDGPWP